MNYSFVRVNHVKADEIKVESDFYRLIIRFKDDYKKFKLRKHAFQKNISSFIDSDSRHRITYIYIQGMANQGKYKIKSIPKFNVLDVNIQKKVIGFIKYEELINRERVEIERKYEELEKKTADKIFNIFLNNYYLRNAVMITNFTMYNTFLKKKKKHANRVWKVVMRGFAKTSPISTYTSIAFNNKNESRINIDELTLLKMYYYFLQIMGVMKKSRFIIEYSIKDDKVITKSCFWQLKVNSQFIGNKCKHYSLSGHIAKVLKSGEELSFNEIVEILGGHNDENYAKICELQWCGLIKNKMLVECSEPSLKEFIEICYKFKNESSLYRTLIKINSLKDKMGKLGDISQREIYMNDLSREIESCFEINLNKTYLSENNYVDIDKYQHDISDDIKDQLRKIISILPIFDYRLLLKFYIKNILKLENPKAYNKVKNKLSNIISIYENCILKNQFDGTIFTQNNEEGILFRLSKKYKVIIKDTLKGIDVNLTENFLDETSFILKKNRIENHCYYNAFIQSIKNNYYLNSVTANYLSRVLYYSSEENRNKILLDLEEKLDVERENLVLYSPGYGFGPNKIDLSGYYKLVSERVTDKKDEINLNECFLKWDDTDRRFQLLKDCKKYIPLYIGSLAPAYLSEDFKILSFISQSTFLTGLTIDSVETNDFTEIGEIRYKNIIIQRHKKILHSRLFMKLTCDIDGYLKFDEIKKKYNIKDQFFIRMFTINEGKVDMLIKEKGMYKPVFVDSLNPHFYEQMIKYINSFLKKYSELAIVFEEAAPSPYDKDVQELSIFI